MITPGQFVAVREKIMLYGFKHQHDGRGPSCSACLRTGGATHAGKDQPVCLTVEEILDELKDLVGEPTGAPSICMVQTWCLGGVCGKLLPCEDHPIKKVDEAPALDTTKMEAAIAAQVGFEFMVSYVDQHGLIRSIYVQAAKDEADAVTKGMEQLLNALRSQLPAPVTRAMSLKMANLERGFLSPEGWVRDRDWRHKR